jgi:hypothetical protein
MLVMDPRYAVGVQLSSHTTLLLRNVALAEALPLRLRFLLRYLPHAVRMALTYTVLWCAFPHDFESASWS